MSNLKDTDIDDLIRRASDKYPLRSNSAEWDKMAAALDKDPTPAGFDDGDDQRRKRRFFWLLLLFPLGGAGYYAWTHAGHGAGRPAVAVMAGRTDRQGVRATTNDVRTAGQDGPTGSGNAARADRQLNDGSSGSGNATSAGRQLNDGSTGSGKANRIAIVGRHRSGAGGGYTQPNRATQSNGTAQPNGASQPYITAQSFTLEWAGDVQRSRIAADYRLSVEVTAPPAAKNPDPPKPKKQKTSYLYAGILGAPDISTVKMQSVKGIGTTFGVLLGYAFNPRWSIETGAYIETKKYYTDGEYFKKTLPYGATLLNVNGTCYMWEIPVNIRYTFNPDGKTKWFATGGLSTYLMSKENYTYAYESNGWLGQSNWNSKKPSQYPFSIVNLSAGFEQRLGRVGSLRLEPYLRLPLQGIGTGKLPIMSAGVNIGITRRLW